MHSPYSHWPRFLSLFSLILLNPRHQLPFYFWRFSDGRNLPGKSSGIDERAPAYHWSCYINRLYALAPIFFCMQPPNGKASSFDPSNQDTAPKFLFAEFVCCEPIKNHRYPYHRILKLKHNRLFEPENQEASSYFLTHRTSTRHDERYA